MVNNEYANTKFLLKIITIIESSNTKGIAKKHIFEQLGVYGKTAKNKLNDGLSFLIHIGYIHQFKHVSDNVLLHKIKTNEELYRTNRYVTWV